MLILFTACDDYLDIRPKGRLIPEKVEDYEKMLNEPQLLKTSTSMVAFMEDNVWGNNMYQWYSEEQKKAYQWQEYVWATDVSTPMDYAYGRIFVYNTIINNIGNADDAGDPNTESIIAEARLGRAWEYFNLVNLYGKHYDSSSSSDNLGVILITKDDITQDIPKRSSVQDIYDFVISEIEEIEGDLPDRSNVFRMNKTAAHAILSRVYLYMGDWQKCVNEASIALNAKSDLFDYNTAFLRDGNQFRGIENFPKTENNPESIFVRFFPSANGVNAYTYATPEVVDLFEDTDMRWSLFFSNFNYFGDSYGDGIYYFYRRLIFGNIGMTVPEVLLNRAEANARLGNSDDALTDINLLRKYRIKTDDYLVLTSDDDDVLKLVLDERRRELMYIGLRWFDLKRLNKDPRFAKDLSRVIEGETYTLPAGDNRYILAFPRNILFFNEHITPNPR